MKRKTKIAIIILTCITLVGVAGYMIIGNPAVFINNNKLGNSIQSIDNPTIQLNNVIPFEWDVFYTFGPYLGKEAIEEIIGFQSADIKENNINEGMEHLLFVKDDKVVASILGYTSDLGYSINLTSKEGGQVTFAENAQFDVKREDGVITLTYAK